MVELAYRAYGFWMGVCKAFDWVDHQQWVYVIETLTACDGKEIELQKALTTLLGPSRKEKGCIFYEIYLDTERPDICMVSMCWKTMDAKKAHDHSSHVKAFEERYGEGVYKGFTESVYSHYY